jgi:hypothetical protein
MHATSNAAELAAPPQDSARDPYGGTPLGVEAAWLPDGIDAPPVARAAET